jgi:5-methylcytosine-specific restriction endonuclease McrA
MNKENSSAYRRNAFLAYPHECAICGYNEDERILEVHHIDENRNHNEIKNLIILCPNCHKKLSLHLYTLQELIKER